MAPAAGFAEVLDRYVDQYESGEPAAARRWQPGVATPSLFWFDAVTVGLKSPDWRTRTASPSPVTEPAAAWTPPPPAPPARPARPPRRLTPLQHRALAELIELGADLDDAFTAEELRTAFRRLARRLHPDRHPTASERETSRLAAAFARAKAAYDDLKRAA